MNKEEFLSNLAQRLGRPRVTQAPQRDPGTVGVPGFHKEKTWVGAAQFKLELEKIGGVAEILPAGASLAQRLRAIVGELEARNAVCWSKAEFKGMGLDELLAEDYWQDWHGQADFRERCAKADVGLTMVQWAVADSGSMALVASPGRPRSVSLLPSVHLAVLPQGNILGRMGEVFEKVGSLPSNLQFITGPSRTADIENDSTIGVHGPAAVHVLIV